jgi:predicted DNA-binding transcriptional regulator YafY
LQVEQIWPPKWGQERRLEFIDFRLLWDGRLNRSDLTGFFGISVPQASADLALYQQRAPGNLVYNRQQKAYIATEKFSPVLTSQDSLSFLNQVRQVEAKLLPKEATFLGSYPSAGVVRPPLRSVPAPVLRLVLEGIRNNRVLRVFYQSMHRENPSYRSIGPHAIVFDGMRWHVRAYCFEHSDFRDFVMARILKGKNSGESSVDASSDACWNTPVQVVLKIAAHLTAGQKRAVAWEYGMKNDRLVIPTRKALLLYMLRQLPLVTTDANSKYNHLKVENRKEIQDHLASMNIDLAL